MNDRRRSVPPRNLAGGTVVCFARLDAGVQRTGKTVRMLVEGALSAFQGLVIIEERAGGPYFLLYCAEGWRSVADTKHETLDLAKAQAEFEYEGVSGLWDASPSQA